MFTPSTISAEASENGFEADREYPPSLNRVHRTPTSNVSAVGTISSSVSS